MIPNRSRSLLASVAALPLVALAVAGCGGGGTGSVSPPTTKDGRVATIGAANESLGKILVNSHGRTLYLFQKDSGTTSECTGACAANWPPLRANGSPTIGGGVNASLLASTMRSERRPAIVAMTFVMLTGPAGVVAVNVCSLVGMPAAFS